MLGDGDERFVVGLGEVLQRYDVPLLGGDTILLKAGGRGDAQHRARDQQPDT